MIFDDLQAGETVFVDANTLIYHFTNHPKYGGACTRLIERIEFKELQGFTSSNCLADVAHRIMTIEAKTHMGWPASGLAARLKKHHAEIPKLSLYQQAASKVVQLGIQVLPVFDSHCSGSDQLLSTIRVAHRRRDNRSYNATAWLDQNCQRGRRPRPRKWHNSLCT